MGNSVDPDEQEGTVSKDRSRIKALFAISSLHFVNDLHPTLLPALLPEIVRRLSLNLAEAGFLNTAFGFLNLMLQPLAGHVADKQNRPTFALWSPLLTASGAYLLPIAPSYGAALLFVCMIGAGTASFHPQGHGITGITGGTERLGSYLAIFAAAGSLGAALSPLYAVLLLKTLGPSRSPFALVLVIVVVLVAKQWLPKSFREDEPVSSSKNAAGAIFGFFRSLTHVLEGCYGLVIISLIRDSSSQGIRVFLPLLLTSKGNSLELAGTVLFAFTVAGSVSNLIGGRLADIFGKRRVIIVMLSLAPLFIFPAVKASGLLSIALFVIGGACIAATNPITLAMAQESAPESRSTASSLVMGVSWGIANIVSSPIGIAADRIGLEATLGFVALAPLTVVAWMLASPLFNKK